MFSKEQSKQLRQDFWIAFGKSYPRKWILYDTKIKGLIFKFHFDLEKAMVSLDVEHPNLERRIELWEKLTAIKTILKDDYLPTAVYEDCYVLENGKEISRIFVEKRQVSIHDKNTWQETMVFLQQTMSQFEGFFLAHDDILSV
ncbi:MAG: DUF4268 domain-containing protein [Flavobacteriaceae bacterium]